MMKSERHFRYGPSVVLGLFLLCCIPRQGFAWDLGGIVEQNLLFDQQMNQALGAMMAQNQMRMQQLLNSYIQQMGPRLQRDYENYVRATGVRIPFEQFAYYHMMTQGGRNPMPALQMQQETFRALQDANRNLQQGYERYNQGWMENQRRLGEMARQYSNQAIRGNAPYYNPYTGEVYDLPYTSGPGYYESPEGGFYQDPAGQYYQLDAGGFEQPLEPYGGD